MRVTTGTCVLASPTMLCLSNVQIYDVIPLKAEQYQTTSPLRIVITGILAFNHREVFDR